MRTEDQSEGLQHRMQPNPEEESSPNHRSQEQRADIALRYDTAPRANQHRIWIGKKPPLLDPKESRRLDFPIDYLEKKKS